MYCRVTETFYWAEITDAEVVVPDPSGNDIVLPAHLWGPESAEFTGKARHTKWSEMINKYCSL